MTTGRFILNAGSLAVVLALALNHGKCQDPIKGEDRLVQQLADAKLPEEMASAYKDLFNKSGKERLAKLKGNGHASVSLRASWEEVLRGSRSPGGETGPRAGAETAMALSRFLGFIEGRVGMTPPGWWEQAVIHSKVGPNGRLMPGDGIKKLYRAVQVDGRDVLMPVNQSIREENKSLIVEDERGRFPLSAGVARDYIRTAECLSVLVDGDTCYIAPHTTSGNSYPVVAIDKSTGKAKWSSLVCDFTSQDNATSGFWREYVLIVRQGDSLVIFGAGVYNFYLECFDVKTGKSRYRFCSFYQAEVKP